MRSVLDVLRVHAAKFATAAIVLVLYALTAADAPHDLRADQAAALASRFSFEPIYLATNATGVSPPQPRNVHPALRHMRSWISSVGAGVAIADIAGSDRPADLCLVDPRANTVTVLPAPGTGARFRSFVLPNPVDGYRAETIAPMGCLPADVNEDGLMDLVVYYWGRTPVAFLQRPGADDLSARFAATDLVAARERWYTNAAVFADVDGDGHADLIFGNYFRDGDRILDPTATDAVEMQHSMSRADNGGRNRLLLWRSAAPDAVTFRDASYAFTPEMANGWTLALGAADLTGDLLPEIYVANDFGPDRLLLNRSKPGRPEFHIVEGRRDLTTPRSKVLGRDSFKGMGVDFGAMLDDGRPAIAVSNISERYGLLESHFLFVHTGDDGAWSRRIAPYRDESGSRGTWTGGWGWDIKFADLDNSGVPQILQAVGFVKGKHDRWPELQELAMGNDELVKFPWFWPRFAPDDDISGSNSHDHFYVADRDGKYHDLWLGLGLDRDTVSRGIAVGDVYGDGRLSVAIARQWMPSLFLRNRSPRTGHWLVLDLRLPGAVGGTRAAIGANARVTLPSGRIVHAEVDGGSGHGGRRAAEIHLGLGADATPQVDVELAWRDASGAHRRAVRLATDQRHRVVLGEKKLAARFDPTP